MNILNNKLFSYDNSRLNDFDYATIGNLILGIGDITWLTRDILHNGFLTVYAVIALLFLLGNVMTVYGLHIHHKRAMFHRRRRRQERLDKASEIEKELYEQECELL